jgi:hypothetical protein
MVQAQNTGNNQSTLVDVQPTPVPSTVQPVNMFAGRKFTYPQGNGNSLIIIFKSNGMVRFIDGSTLLLSEGEETVPYKANGNNVRFSLKRVKITWPPPTCWREDTYYGDFTDGILTLHEEDKYYRTSESQKPYRDVKLRGSLVFPTNSNN